MAATFVGFQAITALHLSSTKLVNLSESHRSLGFRRRHRGCRWKAMVQQQTYQGASANYAKEMERLSAKESLLLAFKDAGGFESLISGKTTEIQQIDVNERVVGLERLNPTPRPTTSPFLEGRWNFEWFGAGSPGLLAARFLFERTPSAVANLIEGKFLLTSKLSVEGPTRMKEEYTEGLVEPPTVSEQAIPEQLKGAFGQATNTLQQLPAPIKDAFTNGLKLPLSGAFQRLILISYLDEEILIIRDSSGAPEVLTRLEGPPPVVLEPAITEYES
ncbi:probable plastid-lipid-associated protein 13, chloroplastic isoform X2 [Dendrobium catenatum]|uniref:probable plastid-lipid-associated protein 13, chloroplastic isoform X2 n=1 Tax=Dendrobium catenatum TaxID=906689 RepID=UPI0009F18348|nr:probable plastid-lipid-associated protein 13, chloroplastic isoform X2 [Dendrobium catenatum]